MNTIGSIIQSKIVKIRQSKFIRNVITTSLGVIAAQILLIVVSPLLTRLYTPSQLGVLAVFTSIYSVCISFINGRYQVPIVIPDQDDEAINIFTLSLLVALILSVLTGVVLCMASPALFRIFHIDQNIKKWLFLVPVVTFLGGVFESLNAWFVRQKKYWYLSGAKVSHSASMSLVQVGVGYFYPTTASLIVGRVVAEGARSGFLAVGMIRRYRGLFGKVRRSIMGRLAIKYKDFLIYESALTAVKSLAVEGPVFFLTAVYGTSTAGFYMLSVRVINSPFSILQLSMNQVFYREIVERHNKKQDLYGFVKKTYLGLFKLSIVPHVVALLTMPLIFKWVFGPTWVVSGNMTQWMVPALLMSFLNSPVTTISQVLNRQKMLLFSAAVQFVLTTGAMWASASLFHDPMITVASLGICLAIYHAFLMIYLLKIAKNAYSLNVYGS